MKDVSLSLGILQKSHSAFQLIFATPHFAQPQSPIFGYTGPPRTRAVSGLRTQQVISEGSHTGQKNDCRMFRLWHLEQYQSPALGTSGGLSVKNKFSKSE